MSRESIGYYGRRRPEPDVTKSKIFAFQKRINQFSYENNIIFVPYENQKPKHQEILRSSLIDTWAIVEKCGTSSSDYVVKYINSYSYGDKIFGVINMNNKNNMDTLWRHFQSNQDYPEFFMGKVEKMAFCKCPNTGEESWNNAKILLTEDPIKNTIVTARIKIRDTVYEKDFVFVKWETANFYEWRMKSGSILQLHQKYIDGLLDKDKKYLRMHT
jgi:hypothetical protein